MPYCFQRNTIHIPPYAEVSAIFAPSNANGLRDTVQQALNKIEPWQHGQDPIETFYLPRAVGAIIVELSDVEVPLWGINPHHTARRPGLSPYITLPPYDPRRLTEVATMELAGPPERPVLTRVYPGEYAPPLPWMSSANRAPGGKTECLEFWQGHAFLHPGDLPVLSELAPNWYKGRIVS